MDLRESAARLTWFGVHAAAILGPGPALAPGADPPGNARLAGRVSVRRRPSAGAGMVRLIVKAFRIAVICRLRRWPHDRHATEPMFASVAATTVGFRYGRRSLARPTK